MMNVVSSSVKPAAPVRFGCWIHEILLPSLGALSAVGGVSGAGILLKQGLAQSKGPNNGPKKDTVEIADQKTPEAKKPE